MKRYWKRLADGVELAMDRTEQFKTGLLSVTLAIPLHEQTACAGALIPEVLYRGSRKYPDIQSLSAAADQLYGASFGPVVRQRGETQCISFLCGFIDGRYTLDGSAVLEPAAELMGGVLLDPLTENGVFYGDYVRSEGANLADTIQARFNDKWSWSIFRMIEEMCAGEAYAVDKLGSVEAARSMTPERLWASYQELLARANVMFYYNGSAEPERVEHTIRRFFAPLMTDRSAKVCCQVRAAPDGPVRTVEDVMDVTQGKLVLGFRTGGIVAGSAQYPALAVCNMLYGGSASSKLFVNVREKMSLCYDASSMLDKLKGVMAVACGTDPDNLDRAQEAILSQLYAIQRGDFTREDLNTAIRMITAGLLSRCDSQTQQEDDCVTALLFGREADDAKRIRAVERVTADDVIQAACSLKLDMIYRLSGREGAAYE